MGFAKYAEDNYEIWEERMMNRSGNVSYSPATSAASSTLCRVYPGQTRPVPAPASTKRKSYGKITIFAVRL